MGMTGESSLLLLDLDGVVIFEAVPPQLERLEIFLLHQLLCDTLGRVGVPVVVLTSRSRVEARRILSAAGVDPGALAGVMAAEDLYLAALQYGAMLNLFRYGLQKSLILPTIERRFGVQREHIAMIDDRLDNLEALLACGLGFALHAPSAFNTNGPSIITFEFTEAIDAFRNWRAGQLSQTMLALTPCEYRLEPWRRTGLNTRRERQRVFNVARQLGSATRRLLVSSPTARYVQGSWSRRHS